MKTRIFLFIITLISLANYAQTSIKDSIIRKKISAVRIDKLIKIDGILDDDAWQNAPIAKDFIELRTTNG